MEPNSFKAKPFLPDCRSTLLQKLVALSAIVFFIFFFKLDLLSKFDSHFLGGILGDAGIYVWLSNLFPLPLHQSSWFETNGFFPYSLSLAFSDNWIFPSALVAGLKQLGISLVTGYNTVYVLALTLSGFFTYLFLFSLTGNFIISVIAAITACHLAPFQHHIGHPQLQHYWILPLVLYLFFKWLSSGFLRYMFFLGIALSVSFLTSVYLALFGGYLFAVTFFLFLLLRPRHFHYKRYLLSLGAFFTGLIPVVFFLNPYRQLHQAFGARFYYEPWTFQATLASFLSFGPFSWLSPLFSLSHSEAHLGIGSLLLTLAGCGFIMGAYNAVLKKTGIILLLLFLSFLLIGSFPSLPGITSFLSGWALLISIIMVASRYRKITSASKIDFFTNQEILFLFFGISIFFTVLSFGPIQRADVATYNPYYVFYHFLPGINGLRAVARFGLVTNYLCLITAFFIITLLHARKEISTLVVFGLSFLILAENYTARFPLEAWPNSPSVFKHLPSSKTIGITLPYGGRLKDDGSIDSYFNFAKQNILSLLWTYEHNPEMKLINGFSGVKTKLVSELPSALFDFPSENSIRTLSGFVGLEAVIVLPEFFKDGNSRFTSLEDLKREVEQFRKYLQIVYMGNDESVLLYLTPAIDASAPLMLLTTSAAKTIRCEVSSCSSDYFTTSQIPGNAEVPFRCGQMEDKNFITLFLPAPIKTVPASTTRIAVTPKATKRTFFSSCKEL